jgi:hypothetical protein
MCGYHAAEAALRRVFRTRSPLAEPLTGVREGGKL